MREVFSLAARVHGGPDGGGVPLHDFSSNGNACGPCPEALLAVGQADASRYPDAGYAALRCQLAAFHGVAPDRVVLAASASEFIFRITALTSLRGGRSVYLPTYAYGDYAQAAQAHGMARVADPSAAALCWTCDPGSPTGASHAGLAGIVDSAGPSATVVLDRAYEPLRLSGALALSDTQLQRVWQLWTPNKALGLTGVRAAYAIAPVNAEAAIQAMEALCPSWPIGAHGVAMLEAWTRAATQTWLACSLATLRHWKFLQTGLCESFGWTVLPGQANFFVCRTGLVAAPGGEHQSAMTNLRQSGIKVRDCSSFDMPGHVRLSVQPPAVQAALQAAWPLMMKGSP